MHLEQFLVGPMVVFAYLIGCPETGRAALIDPGGDEEALVDRAEQQGLKIEKIINTHGHADHTCGNQKVKDLTGAEIIIGQADAELLTGARARYYAGLGFTLSPRPDRTVVDGQVIEVGRVKLEVRHTPGHSPGGICLFTPGHVLTGDTLFVGGVGRTDLPGGSAEVLLRSINDKILSLPEETVVWPGHHYGPEPTSNVGRESRTNPFLRGLAGR